MKTNPLHWVRTENGGTWPEPLLLRPTEAARLLGISRSKLYELLSAGELPVIHIGRAARIPLAQLMDWVDQQLHIQSAT